MNKLSILLVTASTAFLAGIGKPEIEPGKSGPARSNASFASSESRPDPLYEMRVLPTPTRPEAGQFTRLRFRPTRLNDEDEAVRLKPLQGEKLHAFLVSADLGWFQFLDVEAEPIGVFSVQTAFPSAGSYHLYSKYHPTGSKPRVERMDMQVGGALKTLPWERNEQTRTMTDGYTVQVEPEGGFFLAGYTNTVFVTIGRGSVPISAASAGMEVQGVVIREDGQAFAHAVAETEEGMVRLQLPFGKAGLYRFFLEFQVAGETHTTAFTLEARASGPVAWSD